MSKELIEKLRYECGHDSFSVAGCTNCEAADLIERLTTENENLLLANRDCVDHFNVMKDDLTAAQKRIEELEAELKTERCLSFRTQVGELEEQIRHLQMALADTEALEMGTGERLAAAQKRIELYEQALKASWPEGAMGDAFDYWNAARRDDV